LKITHFLVQYLHQNKKMQLQGIGEFTLDNFYENPFEGEKGKIKVPDNSIRFSPSKKTGEDGGLIDYISQQTKKIRPLAASDLEDYLNIGKQLLNVSKQFYIEGLGTLLLNDYGNLEFLQGHEVFAPLNTEITNLAKSKVEDRSAEIDFEKYTGTAGSGNTLRKLLVLLAFAAGLFIIGWIGWYFFQQWQNSKKEELNETTDNIKPVLNAPSTDSSASQVQKDTAVTLSAQNAPEDAAYYIVIETAKRQRAEYRYNDLIKMGYNVSLGTKDSITFKLYTTINRSLSDTTKTMDSLSRFFGRKVYLDLKKPE
jgi:hypothetical protein